KKSGKPASGDGSFWHDPIVKISFRVFAGLAVIFLGVFIFYYVKYDRIINQRFSHPIFSNSATIYALPETVRLREKISSKEIAAQLRRAGYSEQEGGTPLGSFRIGSGEIEVRPGAASYHSPEPAVIRFSQGQVSSITGKAGELGAYELEPVMITSL